MMRLLARILLLVVVNVAIFGLPNRLAAGNSMHIRSTWSFGFHLGSNSFFGDLAQYSGGLYNTPFSPHFYDNTRFMGGITLEKWFGPYFGVKGIIDYGHLQGTKASSTAWFDAWLLNYNLSATIDWTNLILGIDRRRDWMLYSYVGIGFTESRTWKYNINTGDVIGTNGFGVPSTEGGKYIPMTETVIPVGMGFKFFITNSVNISLEASFNPINSDKLDATPNHNNSFYASLEGYNYYSVGMDFWLGAGGGPKYRKGGSRYSYRSGTSINNNKLYRKFNSKVFRRGRHRFHFKRK